MTADRQNARALAAAISRDPAAIRQLELDAAAKLDEAMYYGTEDAEDAAHRAWMLVRVVKEAVR